MGEVLDTAAVRLWSRLAVDALSRSRDRIDAINVFPVPDGDTGTNLHLTVLAAQESIAALPAGAGLPETWRALAQGALRGARGNSGMIVSQFLQGFADVPPTSGATLAAALTRACALSREAVGEPRDGTILTVLEAASQATIPETAPKRPARGASETASQAAVPEIALERPARGAAGTASQAGVPEIALEGPARGASGGAVGDGLAGVARAARDAARRALGRTTGQLDVLDRHGVVDAGAAGLCVLLDVLAAVITEEYPDHYDVPGRVAVVPRREREAETSAAGGPAYEVMYLLDAEDSAVPGLRAALEPLGDSLVVGGGDGLWNVHVHVHDAGAAVEAGIAVGRPYRVRITHLEAASPVRAPLAGRGVVAVTAAGGLAELFEAGGASVVRRESGSVPARAVLLEAILSAGDEVAVLPNEPEVLGVAQAAAADARDSGVQIAVVPTKASVQGLAALAVHDPLRRFPDDVIAMTRAAGATRFGHLEIATQVAFTSVGICRPGDVLGSIDGDVGLIGAVLEEVATALLDRLLSGGGELVTLIFGTAAPEPLEALLQGHLHARRPDVEVVVYDGRQTRYPLLVGLE